MNSIAATREFVSYNWKSVYTINSWWFFGGACLISLLFAWFVQTQVLTDEIYYNYLSDRLTADKIESTIQMQKRIGLAGYLFIPVGLLLKIGFTVVCIATAISFTGYQISFKTIFKIALVAEVAFILSILLKMFILFMFKDINSLEELRNFAPFSLFALFNASAVPEYLRYPLQTINLFEVLYCILLAAGLQFYLSKSFKNMFRLVLASYGIGLLCWVICAVFISINLN